MTILFFALSLALALQWVFIAKLHQRVDRLNKRVSHIHSELDKQAGTVRGLKLIFKMLASKTKEKVDL